MTIKEKIGFKEMLLAAPEGAISDNLRNMFKSLPEDFTSLDVLKILDVGAFTAELPDFVMMLLHMVMGSLLNDENRSYDDIVPLATWRKELIGG